MKDRTGLTKDMANAAAAQGREQYALALAAILRADNTCYGREEQAWNQAQANLAVAHAILALVDEIKQLRETAQQEK